MKCPNCDFPYEGNASICPNCGTPLSNATYSQVEKKPRKKGRTLLIILILLLLLGVSGFFGYRFYLNKVETECLKATETIMECAKNMDFTPLGQENLPEELADQANIRQLLPAYIDSAIEEEGLSEIIDMVGIEKDYDEVANLILSNAKYSIEQVDTTYNSCTVTVTTSNIDYPGAINSMQDELTSIIDNVSVTDWSWWTSLKDWVSQILSGEDKLPTTLSGWLNKVAVDQTSNTKTGQIVYGIKDRKWTLISFDKELIYNFYGFPQEDATN